MDTLRLYGRSMAMLIKSQLQYPLSFLMQTLALILLGRAFWRTNQRKLIIQGG